MNLVNDISAPKKIKIKNTTKNDEQSIEYK